MSDRESFHSGMDGQDGLSGSSDDELLENDLDLDPDDIPVTGFAVASNRRNQEFHEMFSNIPEGDYLIEGACSRFSCLGGSRLIIHLIFGCKLAFHLIDVGVVADT